MKNLLEKARDVAGNILQAKDKDSTKAPGCFQSSVQKSVHARPNLPSNVNPPTLVDLTRYRYHHGCNLGSVFVLEKWLTPSAFPPNATGNQTSELAAVQLSVETKGLDATQIAFEERWNNALSDDCLEWLTKIAHCTSIRLPIGYFTLGPKFCSRTPFDPFGQVYTNAWSIVKKLVRKVSDTGIGVLIDFHAVQGGANNGEHSGTNSGVAELWGNEVYLNQAMMCLKFIASEISCMEGIIGLQIVNEAVFNAKEIYKWYDSVISAISAIDSTLPIYISDGWNLPTAIAYAKQKNIITAKKHCPVCIDTHIYFCFSDADKSLSPEAIIARVPSQLSALSNNNGNITEYGAVQVIVGEYSCVLDRQSWAKSNCSQSDPEAKQLIQNFGHAQSKWFQQRAGGAYFWTLKMDWMPGGEWGFVAQTESGAIKPPSNLLLTDVEAAMAIRKAQEQRQAWMLRRVDEHTKYWDKQCPDKSFEHQLFEDGWEIGWDDARTFMGDHDFPISGAHKIGMLDLWVWKRIVDSGVEGEFVWEFEHGLRAGIKDFYECTGV